jgi:Helix-hairpin-helix motif
MFRSASLNTQPIPDDPSAERQGLVVPWCWPAGARGLLAILALAVGFGLRQASRDVPSAPPTGAVLDLVLDVNTAPELVLAALPHVGPALVRRLVAARNERPFTSLEDLKDRVRGVGPVTLARLTPYLRFESASGFPPEPLAATMPPHLTAMTTSLEPR